MASILELVIYGFYIGTRNYCFGVDILCLDTWTFRGR